MPRSLQSSIIFSSFIWKAFICLVSLSWLFNLVAWVVQLILDIHWFFLTSFLSSEFSVPYRYQERVASSGRKEYFKQLTAGSQEPGFHAYVALQNRVCLNTVGDEKGYTENKPGQECKSLWSEKSPSAVHFDCSDRHCQGFGLSVELKPNILLEIANLLYPLKKFGTWAQETQSHNLIQ